MNGTAKTLNGNVTKEAITRDLEEMKAKGFSGALIFDADGKLPKDQGLDFRHPRPCTGRQKGIVSQPLERDTQIRH